MSQCPVKYSVLANTQYFGASNNDAADLSSCEQACDTTTGCYAFGFNNNPAVVKGQRYMHEKRFNVVNHNHIYSYQNTHQKTNASSIQMLDTH